MMKNDAPYDDAPGIPGTRLDQRIGIFVDVQNMFYSAKLLHNGKIDYGALLSEIAGGRQLVRAIAYIIQKADVNQSGFHGALERMGYELRIKELKIRSDNTAKGNWDVGLTVDAMNLASKLDVVALVTGDGVFAPLAYSLRSSGCRVEVFSFDGSTANDLIRACDRYYAIPEHVVFRSQRRDESSGDSDYFGDSNDDSMESDGSDVENNRRPGIGEFDDDQ